MGKCFTARLGSVPQSPGDYGLGTIVVDPARPTDMYVGGYGAIWKSTDYGLTWSMLNSKPNPPSLSLGRVLAVAGTSPATLWMANLLGDQKVYKSTDAGLTFRLTGTVPGGHTESLYSIIVDPKNSQHLLSGFHEADGLVESNDGGETWAYVSSGQGWPSGGKSWYPFFVDTQDGATPMKTWFVIGPGRVPCHDQRRRCALGDAALHRKTRAFARQLRALSEWQEPVHCRHLWSRRRRLQKHGPRSNLVQSFLRSRSHRVGRSEEPLYDVDDGVPQLLQDRAAAGNDVDDRRHSGAGWGPERRGDVRRNPFAVRGIDVGVRPGPLAVCRALAM